MRHTLLALLVIFFFFFAVVVFGSISAQVEAATAASYANNKSPELRVAAKAPIVFANNYKVEGLLTLPYADLNEPFTVYYDSSAGKSRSDFYGDLYQVYQFSPNKSSEQLKYGALYKFAWVPASLEPHYEQSDKAKLTRVAEEKTKTRRACFEVTGTDVSAVRAQGVLPDMTGFEYDSTTACPSTNVRFAGVKCELWKKITNFDDKTNTYKFWLSREPKTNAPIPVQYYMQGYDTLLGSHYDRYDFKYFSYVVGGAKENDFRFAEHTKCESMPGPGSSEQTSGSQRSFSIVQNPLHEFINEPHNYEHVDHEIRKHVKQHGKKYNNHLDVKNAWRNLLHNSRLINSHNRRAKHYQLSVNKFADRDLSELSYLRGRFHGKRRAARVDDDDDEEGRVPFKRELTNSTSLPQSWDWRLRGAVTPVKDQAVCGSCWSFGTSGAIEGALFVKTGKLVRLSQQQMVDCSWQEGNNGCDGGEDYRAYKYLKRSRGLASEQDYGHYKGVDGKCHDNDVAKSVYIDGYHQVKHGNIYNLKSLLLEFGPVTVGIDASRPTFTFYSHGVYYDKNCKNGSDDLDHQVLVVGYGQLDGQDYWLVKNSWSTLWGNDGYILMSMKDNNCGVLTEFSVPIVIPASQVK